jgi:hypothetical protein
LPLYVVPGKRSYLLEPGTEQIERRNNFDEKALRPWQSTEGDPRTNVIEL